MNSNKAIQSKLMGLVWVSYDWPVQSQLLCTSFNFHLGLPRSETGCFEHSFAGEQQGADMDFVNEALGRFERMYVELEPGDLLFFHPNTLHMSEGNTSDKPRWSMISAYNLSYNKPFREKNLSCITPLETVPNDAMMSSDVKGLSADRDFLQKEDEITLKVKK